MRKNTQKKKKNRNLRETIRKDGKSSNRFQSENKEWKERIWFRANKQKSDKKEREKRKKLARKRVLVHSSSHYLLSFYSYCREPGNDSSFEFQLELTESSWKSHS